MERHTGLDARAASFTLSVISQTGRRTKDSPVETNGQALVEAIRRIPGREHLVFEEGLQSAWLDETLRPLVDEVVVAGVDESRAHGSTARRRAMCGSSGFRGVPEGARSSSPGRSTSSASRRSGSRPTSCGSRTSTGSCGSWRRLPGSSLLASQPVSGGNRSPGLRASRRSHRGRSAGSSGSGEGSSGPQGGRGTRAPGGLDGGGGTTAASFSTSS